CAVDGNSGGIGLVINIYWGSFSKKIPKKKRISVLTQSAQEHIKAQKKHYEFIDRNSSKTIIHQQ
ncbi:TPA: hypothetical protein DE059_01280, partial [Candidatus Peribacteria bacterium]|nr:hypothetical protein [Candidatus Peribacteria bacterium]